MRLVFTERIGFHSVTAHHRTADVEPQFAAPETLGHMVQKCFYLLFIEIHQHAFDHEDEMRIGMPATQVVQPAGIQQGGRNVGVARAAPESARGAAR